MANQMNKTTICVLTAARAEYGLLRPLIQALKNGGTFDVRIAVTGMHLSSEFGLTYRDIELDGIIIDEKIPILLSCDTASGISKSMGLAMIGFADYFERSKPDVLLVLGDRFETLAVCCAALNARIPIVHLHGGEITQGAADEAYRHAITKMSVLHFTSTEEHRKRVIQLGEEPDRVFNVGAIGVENSLNTKLLSKSELQNSIGTSLDKPYVVVTFHPVTLEDDSAAAQCKELLAAIDIFQEHMFIITKANADPGGRAINTLMEKYASNHENVILFDSLGELRYLSALKYAAAVIGNSSSGLVEAPSFGIPTVNIGDRQKGRLQARSVINCEPVHEDIINAIKEAFSDDFHMMAQTVENPYGDGKTVEKIVSVLKDFVLQPIEMKKIFYDIPVEASI